jgi:LacI family transcriptional regulator
MAKLTLDEIGKLAGVSRATVSRVVNGYPHIRPEVRERVERVIQQTGFKPNAVARSLASNRSNIIGLFIPTVVQHIFSDPYFSYLVQGISRACNESNLILSLYLFHSSEEERKALQNIMFSGLIDGLIITADRKDLPFLPALIESQIPFVFVGRPQDESLSFVDTDNVAGAYMAVEYLIKLGRERIATIATQRNTAGDDRYAGYRAALLDSGRKIDRHLIAYGDFSLESGYNAMQGLLPVEPDAVFVASDTMAFGALRAIRAAGLTVPDDIAVVGYDDLPPALHAEPPLTTIQQPIDQTGIEAVKMLIDLINNGLQPPRRRLLSNRLIVRESSGVLQVSDEHEA